MANVNVNTDDEVVLAYLQVIRHAFLVAIYKKCYSGITLFTGISLFQFKDFLIAVLVSKMCVVLKHCSHIFHT